MARGRQRWVEESRKRHCDHVLLPERVIPTVHDGVVRLSHGPKHKKTRQTKQARVVEEILTGSDAQAWSVGGRMPPGWMSSHSSHEQGLVTTVRKTRTDVRCGCIIHTKYYKTSVACYSFPSPI